MRSARVFNTVLRQMGVPGVVVVFLLASACNKQEEQQAPADQIAAEQAALEEQKRLEEEQEAKRLAAEEAAKLAAAEAKKMTIVKDAGFMTPESVLFLEQEDIFLVSNINGSPTEEDNNGFISKVSPDGKVAELKWIAGGEKETTLNAPKGMAIREETLYVADISTIRMFDMKTAASKGEIKIKGATFLNDLSLAPDGTMYVSDSGLKSGAQGLEPTETDAIYKIAKNNKAKPLIKGKELNRPNGLLADDTGVWAVTFGSSELYRVSADGEREEPIKLPAGSLDGIAMAKDGELLISSWDSETIYKGKPGGEFVPIITELKSPADLAYDAKRDQVVVPVFMEDTLRLQNLSPTPVMALKEGAPEPESPAEKAEADGEKPQEEGAQAEAEKPAANPAAAGPAKPAVAEPAKPAAAEPAKPAAAEPTKPAAE